MTNAKWQNAPLAFVICNLSLTIWHCYLMISSS
jgi:hypothetical protein